MKILVFDTGPIISLAMNNLLWLLEPLQKRFNGEFYIPELVKRELIDRPLQSKKFKFEALQVQQYVTNDILKIIPDEQIQDYTNKLLDFANHSFTAHNHYIPIVHYGEISALAAACSLKADALVLDERTTRELVERPNMLADLLFKKLHTPVKMNDGNISQFRKSLQPIKIIRSFELAIVAYELGLLEKYLEKEEEKTIPNVRKTLLEGVLWGIKLNGCAVARSEIDEIISIEEKQKKI